MARYFPVVIHKLKPFGLSNEKAFAFRVSFIDKDRSLIKSYAICSDNIRILISENHMLVPVDFEANFISTIHYENNFCDFIEFM